MQWIIKRKWLSITLVLAFLTTVSGCQYAQQHQGETVGAGVGAAAGTAAGLLFGGSTSAAVAGGLLGAIAGGVVGHYVTKQDQTQAETAKKYNYQPSQGTVISIEQDSVAPETVKPGETVDMKTTYALLNSSPGTEIAVTEERKITQNGQLVGNPQVTVNRTGGTYSTDLPLQLPSTAVKGTYKVLTTVRTATASDSREATFTVE